MGGKRRCIRNGKGKEKQLFRGIFAFIANRDLHPTHKRVKLGHYEVTKSCMSERAWRSRQRVGFIIPRKEQKCMKMYCLDLPFLCPQLINSGDQMKYKSIIKIMKCFFRRHRDAPTEAQAP
eukprot:gene4809-3451_t